MELGRSILLKQLEEMKDGSRIIDYVDMLDAKETITVTAKKYDIPESLQKAFYAYYLDFLVEVTNGSTEIEGVFYNDEDVLAGIHNKIFYFYDPIVKLLGQEHNNLEFSLTIEPVLDDYCTVMVIAENLYGENVIPFGFLVMKHEIKPWLTRFEEPGSPHKVYFELENIYKSMKAVISEAFRIFKVN